jgi:hypothetical protein
VRARAAVVNAALRVATDDRSRAVADEGVDAVLRHRGLVAEVLALVDRPDAR